MLVQGWLIGKLMKLPMWLLIIIGAIFIFRRVMSGSESTGTGSIEPVEPVSQLEY
jgi:flagellar biogenesis protein FliO